MLAGVYGFLGALLAMTGVCVGLIIKLTKKVEKIEKILEDKNADNPSPKA